LAPLPPRHIRLGVAGLGRAFSIMLPTLQRDPRIALVAAADPRPEARDRFVKDFGGATYETVAALCTNPEIEAVYIASPHQHHAEHVRLAASHGKHVLVEKPIALTLADAQAMIDSARAAGIHLVVGHSHSFDAPIQRTRTLISSGRFGAVRMITAFNSTDFLYRPRRPEELDTAQGGGVLFNQAPHQVDVVRLLGGGRVASVRAMTGNWDSKRSTEGAYSALLAFEDGAFASITYNGYGNLDSDEFMNWIDELGQKKQPRQTTAVRQFGDPMQEAAAKAARNYGGDSWKPPQSEERLHQHFGLIVVSCEQADLRPLPIGVMIYQDGVGHLDPLPAPAVPRSDVIDEFYAAVTEGRLPQHDGAWAMATLEVCLAMLHSAREGREISLQHQVGLK
jgi:phthalate 4,5-cis-dihydrodiol dehydrogenase